MQGHEFNTTSRPTPSTNVSCASTSDMRLTSKNVEIQESKDLSETHCQVNDLDGSFLSQINFWKRSILCRSLLGTLGLICGRF